MLASDLFRRARTQRALLSRVVELHLAGQAKGINEAVLSATSGPKLQLAVADSSSVRTSMSRLRGKLELYYRTEGRSDPWRIALPAGSYAPTFVPVHPAGEATAPSQASATLEFRQLYMEARLCLERFSETEIWRAVRLFERALEWDPRSAVAHSGIGDCHFLLGLMGFEDQDEACREACAHVRLALSIDRRCPDAWATWGSIQGMFLWRWHRAENSFRRAMKLKGGSARIPFQYWSYLLMPIGRYAEAERLMREALERVPNLPRTNLHYAILLYRQRRYGESLRQFEQALAFAPHLAVLHYWMGHLHCAAGRYEQALDCYRGSAPGIGTPGVAAHIGYCHARCGRREEALNVLRELEERSAREVVLPHYVALIHMGLGDRARALDWFERGVDVRVPSLALYVGTPMVDDLAAEPRFQAIMRRMNLPPRPQDELTG